LRRENATVAEGFQQKPPLCIKQLLLKIAAWIESSDRSKAIE